MPRYSHDDVTISPGSVCEKSERESSEKQRADVTAVLSRPAGDDETIDKPESSHTTTASETGGVNDRNSHSIVNSPETKPAVYQRASDADATESVACVSNTVSKDTIASASTASSFSVKRSLLTWNALKAISVLLSSVRDG